MSVNPGFGGQAFIPSALKKIRRLKEMMTEQGVRVGIEIDGGVAAATIADIAAAGANIFVAGSAVYGAQDYSRTIAELKRLGAFPAQGD